MKRTFVKISVLAATVGVVLASCNNEEANKKAQEADDLAVESLVAAKELALDSALAAEWDAKVLAAADSVFAAKAATSKKSAPKPVAKKPAVPAPKPVDKGSSTYRPGASTANEVKTTTDRPGASTPNVNKTTSDRPGATKQ